MAVTSGERRWRDEQTGLQLPLKFPAELRAPAGFLPDDPATWPRVEGRLEYVGGRLLYMPPCADNQPEVAPVVSQILLNWADQTPGFVVGGHEAGLVLGGETRGADGAVWRAADLPPNRGKFVRVAPVLAVEVEGEDEDEAALREKARWYFAHGVSLV